MRHPWRGAVLQLLLVLPAAPGAVRSRDEAIARRRAYSEAERRCAKTGLTLLRFDGGGESESATSRAARSRVEAERFETEPRRRGEGEGGRLMPHMGVLLAKLSNASLELALSSLSVVSAEPDCMIYLPSHETPVRVPRRGEARRRRLGVLSAPPSWGLDHPISPLHPPLHLPYISHTSPRSLPKPGVLSAPPSWGLDRIDDRSLPLDNTYDYGGYTLTLSLTVAQA